jgi:hypothetical protein
MRTVPSQIEDLRSNFRPFGPQKLLTVAELCAVFGVSPAWGVQAHQERCCGSFARFSPGWARGSFRSVQDCLLPFDSRKASHRCYAGHIRRIARVNRKGKYTLTRKRFQSGSVRLREDRGPAYWQGFYREDIVTEAGKTVRKRIAVNLGSLKDVPNDKVARQKLAVVL